MSRRIEQHKFNWEDYIKLSERLVLNNTESDWRSSISRAYYDLFCVARDKAGLKDEKISVHYKVIQHYKTSKKAEEVLIGNNLNTLKKLRVKSDYIDDFTIRQAKAKDSVETARKCLNCIYQLNSD
jgi:uncharacterized protein (UPF0332 family)